MIHPPRQDQWGFLLDHLCATPGIAHAIAVSTDGLLIAKSAKLSEDNADQLAACTAGLASLTNGMAKLLMGGTVEQTVVDMVEGRVAIMSISDGSVLTVLANSDADMGQVVYEMAMLINRVGGALTPDQRPTPQA
ncbi:roadblock/LC7 domain-containing protein [Micromonospora sp. WMMD1155]|nr:roadblock/LC7 domain-containing protein [Micromonospora sp. WMMD1155]WFE55231.1 roadblock/LC7 domain-containing protein [Micromonospora sp. WMMD1155]